MTGANTCSPDAFSGLARRGTIDAQLSAVAAGRGQRQACRHAYRGGIDSYLTSLTAQQALYSARRTLVAVELVRATNRVDVYRALGADTLLVQRPGS